MALALNENITEEKVLLIDEKGEKVGVIPKPEAQKRADSVGLDLVKVSDGEDFAVCKIMDYKKYVYEQKKKHRGKDTKVKWKEIMLNMNIGDHDLQVKAKNASKMIQKGNKVKVVLTMKGREISHAELGKKVLYKFMSYCGEDVKVEKEAFQEGNKLVMHLS